MSAPSIKIRNAAWGELIIEDGASPANTITIPYTRGDFTIGPLPIGGVLNEIVKHRARGRRISESYGEKIDPAVSFSMWLSELASKDTALPGTLADFTTGSNGYAGVVVPTSGDGAGVPRTFHLRWRVKGNKLVSTDGIEEVYMRDFYGNLSIEEADDGNVLTCEGEVWGSITVTNQTGTITYASIT